ncbi:MAG: 30S ribosome-binding factor RbfA [Deltaproteobacteria bacterium]|nr:30S ribosome-binding factor RbfA [Deltaproteobacteria bacterium]
MSELRTKRVGSLIRDLISSLLIKQRIKDPRINSLITITDVSVSADLSCAKVYVSSFENENKQQTAVDALNHAAGFIQKNISKDLRMRMTPKLKFYSDSSIKRGFDINEKIDNLEIKSDEE